MAGSSQSCASPNIVLNTIVADAFAEIAEQLEALPPENFHNGLQKILQNIVKKHKRVIFNGDGYKDEWKKEAAKRGLPNLPNTPAALKPFLDPKNIKLFEKYGVFNSKELKSRYEVFMEEYEKKIRIETSLALNMSKTIILPAAIKFLEQLAKTSAEMSSVKWGKNAVIEAQGKLVSKLVSDISKANGALEATIAKNDTQKSIVAMEELRKLVDALEVEVDDVLWPLPKYSELLFVY